MVMKRTFRLVNQRLVAMAIAARLALAGGGTSPATTSAQPAGPRYGVRRLARYGALVALLAALPVLFAAPAQAQDECDGLWCATLTVGAEAGERGYNGIHFYGTLSPRTFTYQGGTVTVEWLFVIQSTGNLSIGITGNLGGQHLKLQVGNTIFDVGDPGGATHLFFEDAPFSWGIGASLPVRLFAPHQVSIADATATVSDHYIKFDVTQNRTLDEGVEFRYRVLGESSDFAHDSSIELQQEYNQTRSYILPGKRNQQIYIPLKEDVAVGDTVNVEIFAVKRTDRGTRVPINDATARGTIGAAPASTTSQLGYQISTKSTTAREPSSSYASALHFVVHLTPSARTLGEYVCYKYETIDDGADAGTATPGDEIVSGGRFTHNPANADYRKTSGRGYFRPDVGSGAASWDSFSVRIFDDDVDDDRETVKVQLSEGHICGDASRTVPFHRDSATGTIRNSDPIPARSFSVRDAEATEGADASLDFVVALGKAQQELVTVDYATSDGTATAGSDYTAQSGTLTFSPGETAKTISVPIANDSVDDDRETVTLTLSNPSTGAAIHDGEAVGTINDYLRQQIWDSTLSPELVYNEYGYIDLSGTQSGSLTSKSFALDGEDYTVKLTEAADWIYIGFDKKLPVGFMLTVDDVELESSDATFTSYSYAEVYRWNAQDIYWDDGADVRLALFRKDLPTTAEAESVGPAITGPALIGETLTAHTSGIFDDDGLSNVSYEYQWIRNDGTDDSEITDATSSTYTLVDADKGQTIKVKVSFTDDDDNEEERTSAATDAVAARPNRAATGTPTISGTPIVGQTLTADTSGIADADGLDDVSYSYQWIANDGTTDTEIEGATGSTFTVLAAYEDQTIKLRVSFSDDAGHSESLTSEATDAVTLTAQAQQSNNVATGAPTISGTAQVGQTLTAATSGISDADGLDDVTYSYQWIRNDGTDDSDISGATGSTYTLVDADQGKTIKVKVSFTDDADNDESLTSAATGEVAARPNRAATGAPTITGTSQVGQTLTVGTSGISDADGLTNVSYSYQWIRNDGTSDSDISGATSSTYALVDTDEGKTIKVKVSFTDDAGYEETLSSTETGEVAASGPDEPPVRPEGLTGTVAHDSVTLTWDDPDDDTIKGYQILRRVKGLHDQGDFQILVDDTGSASTTYTDLDVSPENRYIYRIKARNAAGLSERSLVFKADTPSAPENP